MLDQNENLIENRDCSVHPVEKWPKLLSHLARDSNAGTIAIKTNGSYSILCCNSVFTSPMQIQSSPICLRITHIIIAAE